MTDDWTPIALGRDVPSGTTRAVLLDGRELVIWRGDGAAHVWEDRCPHRGMRLSLGFVRDNALNCLYHGWQYGSSASCVRIPAHPDLTVPPSIKVAAFASAEVGGMIWVRLAGEAAPPEPAETVKPVVSLAVEREGLEAPHLALYFQGSVLHLRWHRTGPGRIMVHAVLAGDGDAAAAARFLRAWRDDMERQAA